MRFAALFRPLGVKIHVGCVMSAGHDWIEVSLPCSMELLTSLQLMLYPSPSLYPVEERWRRANCVGLTYTAQVPAREELWGISLFGSRLIDSTRQPDQSPA